VKHTLRLIRRLLHEQPLRFSLVVFSAAFAGLLDGLWIAALVPLLDMLGGSSGGGGTMGALVSGVLGAFGMELTLLPALGLVLVLVLFQQAATFTQQKLAFGSIYKFEGDLRERLYRAVFEAGWPFFVSERASNLVNAITVEAQRASGSYNYLNQLLAIGLVVTAYAVLALFLSVPMTLFIAAGAAVFLVALRRRVSRGSQFGIEVTAINQDLQGAVIETISGAKLVKGVAAEPTAIGLFSAIAQRLAHQQYRLQMNHTVVKVTYDSLSAVLVVCSIWIATVRFGMPLAELTVFLVIFARLAPRVSNMTTLQHNLLAYMPGLDRIDALVDAATAQKETSGTQSLGAFEDGITFDAVTFGYDPTVPVVRDLSLRIPAGQVTAIVGPSGAGKTTVIDLVMRLILPQSGSVTVNGVDMADIDVADWRRRIGYVAQDSVLFHASVADNIRFGAPDATDEQVRTAARLAFADEFVTQMPEGYETLVGDRGVRLSGGQRQRIALARAIVGKPDVLILDEATSALDAASEQRIQESIAHLAESMTILYVTHRLSTVRDADLVYVLEDGQLVESGSWEALVARKGRFFELRQLQDLDGEREEALSDG